MKWAQGDLVGVVHAGFVVVCRRGSLFHEAGISPKREKKIPSQQKQSLWWFGCFALLLFGSVSPLTSRGGSGLACKN